MRYLNFCGLLVACFFGNGQHLEGAWEWVEKDENGKSVRGIVIFAEDFQSAARFDAETGAFISTNGGKWTIEDNHITEIVEFDSQKPEETVGKKYTFQITWDGKNKVGIEGKDYWMHRIDRGKPGKLNGAWLMSGRKKNGEGEIQQRNTNRPRKTMKILSGTRFQWIAYNTETKEFKGTGGGTYTTMKGKYTENIEFFSRDNTRVGACLEFNYKLIDRKWHHSGKSSKGNPLYEVWSMRDK